mgnify:CR=1 FL=1
MHLMRNGVNLLLNGSDKECSWSSMLALRGILIDYNIDLYSFAMVECKFKVRLGSFDLVVLV